MQNDERTPKIEVMSDREKALQIFAIVKEQARSGGSATQDTTSKQPGPYFTKEQWVEIELIAIDQLNELGQVDLCIALVKLSEDKMARGELL